MERIDKIVREAAASFQIDNIKVSSELMDNSKMKLELLLKKDDKSHKILVRKVR